MSYIHNISVNINRWLLFIGIGAIAILNSSCECPTSQNISYDSEALEGAAFQLVDATGDISGLRFEIAEIEQLTIPSSSPMPYPAKIESGKQVLSIFSNSNYYFSGPIHTAPEKEYIGILYGKPLFANFCVMATDTLPQYSVFNASKLPLSLEDGKVLSIGKLSILDSKLEQVAGQPINTSISKGMIVILATEPNIQFAEISY